MNINDFIKQYDKKTNDDARKTFARSHIKDVYVNYEEKVAYAQRIMELACWADVNGEKRIVVNTPTKFMLECLTVIKLYTDIELPADDNKTLEYFNQLNNRGIIDFVITEMNQHEVKEFNMVVQMVYDDLMTNEYEARNFVTRLFDVFKNTVSPAIPSVINNLDGLAEFIKSLATNAEAAVEEETKNN